MPGGAERAQHVAVGGAADAGDEADPQRQGRHRQAGLGPQQPLGRQRLEQHLAPLGQAPEREGGVDGEHAQADLALAARTTDLAADPDLGAVGHAHGVAGRRERPVDPLAVSAKSTTGSEQPSPTSDEVDVPVGRALEVVDLAPHPQRGRELAADGPLDPAADLGDRERAFVVEQAELGHRAKARCRV